MITTLSIQCCDIQKTYGVAPIRVQALKGVNLEVTSGETMMIMGPSGCGKTTLISIITGTLGFDGGTCTVMGQDLSRIHGDELVRWRGLNIGFVFQSFNLIPTLSVAENVAIPLLIKKEKISSSLEKARSALDSVGLSDKTDMRPTALSGGQQQRVAIARAIIHRPKLLVCDEPTSALDAKSGVLVLELLKRISGEHGTTLIIVTHDHRILKYGDRVTEIEDGQVQSTHTHQNYLAEKETPHETA
jgi:putative ABC transport system ATP-binding protein